MNVSMDILPLEAVAAPDVAETAQRRLRESAYFYLRSLSCEVARGVLTLRGTVPWEQLRRQAERIVARVPGVDEVINCVEVVSPEMAYVRSRGA